MFFKRLIVDKSKMDEVLLIKNRLPLVRVTTPKGRVILRRPGQPLVLAPSDWETSPLGQGYSPLWEGYTPQAWQATNYSPL